MRGVGGQAEGRGHIQLLSKEPKNKFYIRPEQADIRGKKTSMSQVPNSSSALQVGHRLGRAGRLGGGRLTLDRTRSKEWLLVTCPARSPLSLSPRWFFNTSLNDLRYFGGLHAYPLFTLS